jgi:hypothetical protein
MRVNDRDRAVDITVYTLGGICIALSLAIPLLFLFC